MVGDDDNFVFVPNFRVLAKFAFEHADGARPANVMCHEHVRVHPDVVAGLDFGIASRARENFFRQRHSWKKYLMRGASSTAQAGLSERRLWTDVDGGASGQGRAGGGSRDVAAVAAGGREADGAVAAGKSTGNGGSASRVLGPTE